eukprot:4876400-Prorocentrum_lima.AAC.1
MLEGINCNATHATNLAEGTGPGTCSPSAQKYIDNVPLPNIQGSVSQVQEQLRSRMIVFLSI